MFELYRNLAYCFVCVVLLVVVTFFVNRFGEKHDKTWRSEVSGVISIALFIVAYMIMHASIEYAGGAILIGIIADLIYYKEI